MPASPPKHTSDGTVEGSAKGQEETRCTETSLAQKERPPRGGLTVIQSGCVFRLLRVQRHSCASCKQTKRADADSEKRERSGKRCGAGGTLRNFGLKVGMVGKVKFEKRSTSPRATSTLWGWIV